MKLPFNIVLSPLLKPYLGSTRNFCNNSAFIISIYYTYVYGVLGFFISANHLWRHLGEYPPECIYSPCMPNTNKFMIIHDLKIVTTSMGIVQYVCLFFGCLSGNPSLFLPHLLGQLIVIAVKMLQALLLMASANTKAIKRFFSTIPAISLLIFNWCQEFCVFRQFLCVCDL